MEYTLRITEEAEKLFMKYGIRAVTMDMIASELGMSKRTIYEKFHDKDTLLAHVIKNKSEKQKEVFHKLDESCENVIELIFTILSAAFSQIREASPNYMLDLKKYHHKVYKMVCSRGDIRNSEMSLAILKRGVKEKIFRHDINIEMVNEGVQGFIDAAQAGDLFSSGKFSRFDIIDNLLINYLRGISTELGIQLLIKYREQLGINKNGNTNEN